MTQAEDVEEKEIFFFSVKSAVEEQTSQMVKIVQHARDEEEGYIEMEDQSGQENTEEKALHDKIGN